LEVKVNIGCLIIGFINNQEERPLSNYNVNYENCQMSTELAKSSFIKTITMDVLIGQRFMVLSSQQQFFQADLRDVSHFQICFGNFLTVQDFFLRRLSGGERLFNYE
jgi:hypothetical protein